MDKRSLRYQKKAPSICSALSVNKIGN
ncbi:hypothetical protein D043_2909A, partial [Vibrio parahaemolyticus EKP-021]